MADISGQRTRGRYFFDVAGPDANREGDAVEITCTVTLLKSGDRQLVPRKGLDFYVGGRVISTTTDGNGTASVVMSNLRLVPGDHTLKIQVSGEAEFFRKSFSVKPGPKQRLPEEIAVEQAKLGLELRKTRSELEKISLGDPVQRELEVARHRLETKKIEHELGEIGKTASKIPAKLSVSIAGERGKQKLLIVVTAADGNPVAGVSVAIRNGSDIRFESTGSNGMFVCEGIDIPSGIRPFEVRVGNEPGLVWRGALLGRS